MFKLLIAIFTHAIMVGTLSATSVTYFFSGTLNDPFGSLSAGTPFSGSFSYDSAQNLNTPLDPFRGDYLYTSLTVTIGESTVTDAGTGVMNVYDHGPAGSYPPDPIGETTGYPTDLLAIYTFSLSGSLGGLTLAPGAGIQIVLQDVNGDVFDGPEIPGSDLTINDFTLGGATFLELQADVNDPFFSGGFQPVIARGELSHLSANPVPDTGSWLIPLISCSAVLAGNFLTRKSR